MTAFVSCIVYNYGLAVVLAFLLAFSEWLGGNSKVKENAIYQLAFNFLKHLNHKE